MKLGSLKELEEFGWYLLFLAILSGVHAFGGWVGQFVVLCLAILHLSRISEWVTGRFRKETGRKKEKEKLEDAYLPIAIYCMNNSIKSEEVSLVLKDDQGIKSRVNVKISVEGGLNENN